MSDNSTTVVPDGFIIKRLPAKIARGAYKPRNGVGASAQTTAAMFASADRRNLLNRASRSHQGK